MCGVSLCTKVAFNVINVKKFGHGSSVCKQNIIVEESKDALCCNCDGDHIPEFSECRREK